jgi:hypothetical protein
VNRPVDVLAVLDRAIAAFPTTPIYAEHLAELHEARTAVAELIEAANRAVAFVGYDGVACGRVRDELRAALANVGSAS